MFISNYLRKQSPIFILSEIQKNKGVIRPSINVFEITINDGESTEELILDSLADLDELPADFKEINIVRQGKYYRFQEGYLRSIYQLRWRLNR